MESRDSRIKEREAMTVGRGYSRAIDEVAMRLIRRARLKSFSVIRAWQLHRRTGWDWREGQVRLGKATSGRGGRRGARTEISTACRK
jgi:hypothetical protein